MSIDRQPFLHLIEHAWKTYNECLIEESRDINESLNNKSLVCLLTEQEQEKRIEVVVDNVNVAADKATASIEALMNSLPAGQMNSVRDALNRARGEVAMARLEQGSTLKSLIGSPMRKILKIFTNVQIMLSSLGNAFTTAYGALQDLGAQIKDDPEAKEQPIEVLINQHSTGEAAIPGLPGIDDFKKAMASKLQPPKGVFGGLGQGFSKILDMLPGLDRGAKDVGFGLTQDQFMDDVMQLPMSAMDGFYGKAQDSLSAAMQPDESDPVQSLNYGLESVGIDPEILTDEERGLEVAQEELEGAVEVEEEEAGYLLTPNDLRGIKGAMDAAKRSKKSQSKALGGALNSLVGQQLFVENIGYSEREAKLILSAHNDLSTKTLLGKESDSTMMKDYSDDEMVRYRLMKLAKLF